MPPIEIKQSSVNKEFTKYEKNVLSELKIKLKSDSTIVFCSKDKNFVSVLTNGILSEDGFFEYYGVRYGKFVANRLFVGGELGRSWFGEWERTTHFGVYSRYYYAVFKHFSYYVDAKCLVGYRNYENERTLSKWTGRTHNFAANLGIAFIGFYKKRFGLEIFTGYAFNTLGCSSHIMQVNFHNIYS